MYGKFKNNIHVLFNNIIYYEELQENQPCHADN